MVCQHTFNADVPHFLSLLGATRRTDMCNRNKLGACSYSGYLNFWSQNFDTYLASMNGSVTDPTAGNLSALISVVNSAKFPDGRCGWWLRYNPLFSKRSCIVVRLFHKPVFWVAPSSSRCFWRSLLHVRTEWYVYQYIYQCFLFEISE